MSISFDLPTAASTAAGSDTPQIAVSDQRTRGSARSTETAGHWILVETLGGSQRTVVSEGTRRREFTSLSRTRGASGPTVARQLSQLIAECTRTAETHSASVHVPNGKVVWLSAIPVIGTGGVVDGAQVWSSSEPAPPPERTIVGALSWDASTGSSTYSPVLETSILGISAADQGRPHALPDLFGRMLNLPDKPGFLALFTDLGTSAWSGEATILGNDGRPRNVLIAARSVSSAQGRGVRALIHDVGDSQPSAPPNIEVAVMRRLATQSATATGLVDLRTSLIYEWLSPPRGTGLDRWRDEVPEIHPTDVADLMAARMHLLADRGSCTTRLRIRFDGDQEWTPVALRWTLVAPGSAHGMVEICRPSGNEH